VAFQQKEKALPLQLALHYPDPPSPDRGAGLGQPGAQSASPGSAAAVTVAAHMRH